MRYLIMLIVVALLSQTELYSHDGVIITGQIKNFDGDFVILSHVPRLRGNLNYDGFVSIGAPVSAEGHFRLESKTIVSGGLFSLELAEKGLGIELLAGDSIHLTCDMNDLWQSLCATGRGAAKINLSSLEEFQYVPFDEYDNIDSFKMQLNHKLTRQLAILDAIRKGDLTHPVVVSSSNRMALEKIIRQNTMSTEEYEFLKEKMFIWNFSITSFLQTDAASIGLDSLTNISPYLVETFREEEYANIRNINHPFIVGSLDAILDVEFARYNLSRNDHISHRDFSRVRWNPQYYEWIPSYVKEHFSQDIFEKWFADQIAYLMSRGSAYDEQYEQFKAQCSLPIYQDRLADFHHLLSTGLRDPEYQLDDPRLTLDQLRFDKLLTSYQGQPVYIVFWSAEYAGSSIINHIPLIKKLEDIHDKRFKVIQICIDKKEKKHLWAARIIDNQWHGEHYFMPIEDNEHTLVDFGSERISSFCNGGATYSFLDASGDIHKDIQSPRQLKKYVIRQLLD